MNSPIPFNRPYLTGNELRYVQGAVDERHISGDGMFTRKCQDRLEELLGASRVLLTTSCTDALEMAALLLRLRPGDEVIVPAFSFVSTANAFALHGARPVFADVRPDTLNLDEERVESLITDRTRALVVVHYAGVGCEMDRIAEIAARHGLDVVEDNALGLPGRWDRRPLASFGRLAALSFHETKNFTCGEGGALVINDEELCERAEVLRQKGTDRVAFVRGEVDRYTWRDLGSSYLPSDLLAAYLLAQLEAVDEIQLARQTLWQRYFHALEEWSQEEGVRLPTVPSRSEQSYSTFYMRMPTPESREALIDHLGKREITAVFHYQPLHLSEMGRRFGGAAGDCPVTEEASRTIVRLPFYAGLSDEELDRVVGAVRGFSCAAVAAGGLG